MKLRNGLQAKFLTLVGIVLLLMLLGLGALLQRQVAMQGEVIELSRESIQELIFERLSAQAEAVGQHTADALINSLYNFDLEKIGRVVRDVLAQPDVQSVTVYDADGAVVHDGSDNIASFGQRVSDDSTKSFVASDSLQIARHGDLLNVTAPIRIGDERLGGVRIAYSLASVQVYEEQASELLSARISKLGERYLIGIGMVLLIAFALGILISWIVQRTLIKPIRRLANAAREIEAGNFSAPLPSHSNKDEIGDLVQAFSRMTEAIYRRDQDIHRIANTDVLTGLANRRAFRAHLEVTASKPPLGGFALVLIDIDNFKPVNDRFGHEAGDRLLCQFAERVRAIVAKNEKLEGMPARLGGDEFILTAKLKHEGGSLREAVETLARGLIEAFAVPMVIGGESFVASASFGIALCPGDAGTAAQLMKKADLAMYAAKRSGKNSYRFSDDLS